MNIIFLTGYSGAGKSTAAEHLTNNHQFGYLSFRTITKEVAERSGYSHVDYLEQVDNAIIFRDVGYEIVERLAQDNKKNILVDGLYYLPYVDSIKKEFPDANCLILAIEADRAIRQPRMETRDNNVLNNIDYLDNYKNLIGIEDVLAQADVLIQNNSDINLFLHEIELFAFSMDENRKLITPILKNLPVFSTNP